jgi:signal transduction histidine kinase
LSIVDATVSAHGGAVDIDSEKGRGTTVRLTMPARQ